MPHRNEEQLKRLAEQIQAIEEGGWAGRRDASGDGVDPEGGPSDVVATGWAEVDRVLGGGGRDERSAGTGGSVPGSISRLSCGLRRGALHEWFGVAEVSATRKGCLESWTPPLCLLVHLAWQALAWQTQACQPSPATRDTHSEASETAPETESDESGDVAVVHRPGDAGAVVWIGRRCWPHPRVMVRREPGFDEEEEAEGRMLLERSLFADPSGTAARLWAVDLALRSPAVTVVVADGSGLDMAATRRLQLAAESGRGMALLARPPYELPILSVAATRWVVAWEETPGRKENPDCDEAVASPVRHGAKDVTRLSAFQPRWVLTLQRCRSQQAAVHANHRWTLEWKRGRFVVVAPSELVDRPGGAALEEAGIIATRRTA